MRIDAVAHCFPRERLGNSDVVDIFRTASLSMQPRPNWERVERYLARFLKRAGAEYRYVATKGESPLDLAVKASKAVLTQANLLSDRIELLVYASVSRGWLEPCTAVAMQKKLGAVNATSFDVLDACASWLRALHVTHAMLKTGAYKNALIISVEAGMRDFVNVQISDTKDLERYGAASTLGNVATATLLSHTSSDDFYFVFKTQCADMGLCMLPMANYTEFMPELKDEAIIEGKFIAYSTSLLQKTLSFVVETYKDDPHLSKRHYDLMFSHSVSTGVSNDFCQAIGLPMENYFSTFAEHGNTAAATVPLGMSLAIEKGLLKRGHQVCVAVGGAGITAGFATFTF